MEAASLGLMASGRPHNVLYRDETRFKSFNNILYPIAFQFR